MRDDKKNYILLAHTKINYVKKKKIKLKLITLFDSIKYHHLNHNKLLFIINNYNFIIKFILVYYYDDFYYGIGQKSYRVMSSLSLYKDKNCEKNVSKLINEMNNLIKN